MQMAELSNQLLSAGTVKVLYQGERSSSLYGMPRLQIIHVKRLRATSSTSKAEDHACDRYSVLLSDGVAYMHAMLGMACNELAAKKRVKANSLITLKQFTLTILKNRRILLVLDVDTELISQCDTRIGNPSKIEDVLTKDSILSGPPISNNATNPLEELESSISNCQAALHYHKSGPCPLMYDETHVDRQKSKGPLHVDPISSLGPYKPKWMIYARCVGKSEIQAWSNGRNEGKLFHAILLDASGEIRVIGFNHLCSVFHPILKVGSIYKVSNATVRPVRKKFSSIANEFELHLDKDSIVIQLSDDELQGQTLPNIQFSFVKIRDLRAALNGQFLDIVGIVFEIGALNQLTRKSTHKMVSKRDLLIVDDSCCCICITLWGKQAEEASNDEWSTFPVLAIKGAKVSEYNGKSISVTPTSLLQLNPDIPERCKLQSWFLDVGRTASFTSLSSTLEPSLIPKADRDAASITTGSLEDRCVIRDMKDKELAFDGRVEIGTFTAKIVYIKSDGPIGYPACPGYLQKGAPCQKKVIHIGPSRFRCERCARDYESPLSRYILSLIVADFSGQTWLTAFDEAACEILSDIPAKDLMATKDSSVATYLKTLRNATYQQYVFQVRIKDQVYQGECKSRASIMSLASINFINETRIMLQWISSVTV